MNRTILVLTLAIAAAPAAAADRPDAAAIAATLRARDSKALDLVADCGAVAGEAGNPAANADAFHAAMDAMKALRAEGYRGAFSIALPDAPIKVGRPLWWDAPCTIKGTGPNSALRLPYGVVDSTLLIGLARRPYDGTPGGHAIATPRAIPTDGRLDATAAGRRGVDLGADSFLYECGGPLAFGADNWSAAEFVTQEWAYQVDDPAEFTSKGYWFYLSPNTDEQSWKVWHDGINVGRGPGLDAKFGVEVRAIGGDGTPVSLWAAFDAPRTSGVHRVGFEIDVKGGSVRAWADGRFVECGPWVGRSNPGPDPGRKVARNDSGAFYARAVNPRVGGEAGTHARRILGYHAGRSPRYAPGLPPHGSEPGSPLVRLDGRAADDFNTYFNPDSTTVGLLAGDAAAELMTGGRYAPTLGRGGDPAWPPWRSSAQWMSEAHASPYASLAGYRLDRVAVGGFGPWADEGDALPLGVGLLAHNALLVDLDRCRLAGGSWGFASTGFNSATYPVRASGCTFSGVEGGIYAYYSIFDVDHADVPRLGRTGFARVAHGKFTARDVFTTHIDAGKIPATIVEGRDNADVSISRMVCDVEWGSFPTRAFADMTSGGDYTSGGRLALDDVTIGAMPPGVPFAILRQGVGATPASVRLVDCQAGPLAGAPLVRQHGAADGWRGRVEAPVGINPASPVLDRPDAGPTPPAGGIDVE